MKKERTSIPTKTRELLLREFNHCCSICGANNPHIHHIDEDPSNNDPMNLLPLCPNCHLIDQHNPTQRLDSGKLALFRKFKDPTILSPTFDPLFQRLRFLDSIVDDSPANELNARAAELVAFVRALQMGEFYARQIQDLIKEPGRWYVHDLYGGPDPEYERKLKKDQQEYREQLRGRRDQVITLVVELLRFQAWDTAKTK